MARAPGATEPTTRPVAVSAPERPVGEAAGDGRPAPREEPIQPTSGGPAPWVSSADRKASRSALPVRHAEAIGREPVYAGPRCSCRS